MRWTTVRCEDCGRPVREEPQEESEALLIVGENESCLHCGRPDKLRVDPPRWWGFVVLGAQQFLAQFDRPLEQILSAPPGWQKARRLTRTMENHNASTGQTNVAEILWIGQLAKLVPGEVWINTGLLLVLSPLTETKERELSKRWLEVEQSGGPEVTRGALAPRGRIQIAGTPIPKSILKA